MNKLLIMGWILVSTLAAYYVGLQIGRRYLYGRINTGWVIALTLISVLLALWIDIEVLTISPEYVFWIYILIGAVSRGASTRA